MWFKGKFPNFIVFSGRRILITNMLIAYKCTTYLQIYCSAASTNSPHSLQFEQYVN